MTPERKHELAKAIASCIDPDDPQFDLTFAREIMRLRPALFTQDEQGKVFGDRLSGKDTQKYKPNVRVCNDPNHPAGIPREIYPSSDNDKCDICNLNKPKSQ